MYWLTSVFCFSNKNFKTMNNKHFLTTLPFFNKTNSISLIIKWIYLLLKINYRRHFKKYKDCLKMVLHLVFLQDNLTRMLKLNGEYKVLARLSYRILKLSVILNTPEMAWFNTIVVIIASIINTTKTNSESTNHQSIYHSFIHSFIHSFLRSFIQLINE